MWAFFVLSVLMVVVAVAYMLYVLPARGVPGQVKVVVGYAWLVTLLICCIVPIDVFSTLDSQSPPAVMVLWDISYWSTQLLTWFLIPVYMGYADAGEFTWKERMWASIRSNGLFYICMGVVGALGLFWAVSAGQLSLTTLPNLGMQLANTFGLFCVLTLLGYGLVALPKLIWKRSNAEQQLRHTHFRLGRIADEKQKAQDQLVLMMKKVYGTKRSLGRTERESLDRIEEMLDFIKDHLGDVNVSEQAGLVEDGVRYTDALPRLHKEIKKDVYQISAIRVQESIIIDEAIRLTEIVDAAKGGGGAEGAGSLDAARSAWDRIAWNFTVFALPWVFKLTALLFAALSVVILWCEVTAGIHADLSPLSLLLRKMSSGNEFWCQMMIMLPMLYVISCTYSAFFAINVGSLYALTPTASSSFSLLFNANLVARFAAPLCFNYLHVISMDRHTANGYYTVFASRMGLECKPKDDDPDVESCSAVAIPFLGTDFNRWAPVLILVVVGLTSMNAFGKAYHWLTSWLWFLPEAYNEDEKDDEYSDTSAYVFEGKRLVDAAIRQGASRRGAPSLEVGFNLLKKAPFVPTTELRSGISDLNIVDEAGAAGVISGTGSTSNAYQGTSSLVGSIKGMFGQTGVGSPLAGSVDPQRRREDSIAKMT